jgi:tetratricopeptide (TPR) repeat protein
VHLWRGFTLMRRGDLLDAAESLQQALDEFELYGYGADAKLYAGGFLALAQLAAAGPAAARRTLERTGPPLTYSNGSRFWRTARLTLLVQEGRSEEARRLARELRTRHGWIDNPSDSPWRSLEALALDGLGRHDEALAAAEEELAAARRWGAPGTVGPALRVLGTLRGDPELLEQAVELLRASPRRLELALALAAHGEELVAA